MKESSKPANRPADLPAATPAQRPKGAFEVVGTAAGGEAASGGPRRPAAKAPGRKPARRPTFVEPLEGRTIIG